MKFALNSKLATMITTGVCSMSLYVMAGGNKAGQGPTSHGNGNHGNAGTTATTPTTPASTPPGNHFGWEKGRHNPHHSASATPAASATPEPTASATPTPEATASPTATPTPTP